MEGKMAPTPNGIFIKLPIAGISFLEFAFYFAVEVGIILYAGYEASKSSFELIRVHNETKGYDLEEAGAIRKGMFGYYMDNSDEEWEHWGKNLLPWLCFTSVYVTFGVMSGKIPQKVFKFARVCITFSFMFYMAGVVPSLPVIFNVLLAYYLAIYIKHIGAVWALNLATIWWMNSSYYSHVQLFLFSFSDDVYQDHKWTQNCMSLLMFLYSMVILRFTSAAPGLVKGEVSLIDYLYYCFYLPCLFTGPLETWETFSYQVENPLPYKERFRSAFKLLLRVMFALVIAYAILHLMLVQTMGHADWWLKDVNLFALFGIGLFNGVFFQTKYFVMLGLPGFFALLDGMTPYDPPKCIVWIFHYSSMWKSFDRGLYEILKSSVYIPLGGSRFGLLRQFFAASVTFSYISFWHGSTYVIMMWCLLDYMGIQLESVFRYLERKYPLANIKSSMSPVWWRRFYCLVNVPLWYFYIFAIFTFFCGKKSGEVYLKRFITEASYVLLITSLLSFYCGVQVSVSYQRQVLLKHQKALDTASKKEE